MASAFVPSLVNSRGVNPYESQSGYGSPIADWQRDNVIAPMVRSRGSGFMPYVPPGSPGNWSPIHAPTINLNIGQPDANEFSTVQNVKNSALQTAMDSILKQGSELSTDPTKNPFVLQKNVKDDAMQSRISAAGGRFDTDSAANRESLADFTKNYYGSDPAAKAFTDEETGAIGNIYRDASDPRSMAFNLATLRKQKQLATDRLTQQALHEAIGQSKLNSLMGVNDSSVDQRLLDATGRIATNSAATSADQARADYMATIGAQTSMAGRRGALLDDYLKRGLVPIDARMKMGASELSQLGQIGQMTNANNVYTMDSPDMALMRKMGVLSAYGAEDRANNFYGLRKPYSADGSGYIFPGMGGGGGAPSYRGGGPGGWGGFDYFGGPGSAGVVPPTQPPRARYPRPGLNAGTGTGFAGDPTGDFSYSFPGVNGRTGFSTDPQGGYDLNPNFMDYGNPLMRQFGLYQPGFRPEQAELDRQWYDEGG